MVTTMPPETSRRVRDLTAALKIDGWLSEDEAGLLYDLAKSARGPIVEIGSYLGRSTACLALGSMAGTRQPVYAIDPFTGPQEGHRPTNQGNPKQVKVSPEILRANLDRAGVNGLVKIVPLPSQEAAGEIPDCDVLFIDGAHDRESVLRDFDNYLPKVMPGGSLFVHDVTTTDMGVVEAVDERLMTDLATWRIRGRAYSGVLFQKAPSPPRKVMLAFPGHTFAWGPITGVLEASLGRHEVKPISGGAHGWDDFNYLWAKGLNAFEAGEVTHFAMLHSDITPDKGWLDILLGELDDTRADMISALVPIKDGRGLTSTGMGDLQYPWGAHRRLTMREALDMPTTFGLPELSEFFASHTLPKQPYLLVNSGCWVADLRQEKFRATDAEGCLRAWFDFPTRVRRNDEGKWANERESEDWFFSRKMHELGIRPLVTRKVWIAHQGGMLFTNDVPHGEYRNGDEQTRDRWNPKKEESNCGK